MVQPITATIREGETWPSSYMHFIAEELVPAVQLLFPDKLKERWAFAGFSLGGLSALDISWKHGHLFNLARYFFRFPLVAHAG